LAPLDPRARPPLVAEALVTELAAFDVTWLLAGSYVLRLYGADLEPNDLDVVVERSPENLERVAQLLDHLEAVPQWCGLSEWDIGSVEDHLAWKPWPATTAHLDQLFVTQHGMFDLPFKLVPDYAELLPGSSVMAIGEVDVRVCDPRRVLKALETRDRKKDRARAEVYAEMRRRFGLS